MNRISSRQSFQMEPRYPFLMQQRLAQLILVLWAGSLWTLCGFVVPGLFYLLANRTLAGNTAAQFFYAETFLGLLLGLIYLSLRRGSLDRINTVAAIVTMAMPAAFFVVLRPIMATARAAGDTARFGQLHGVAGGLFLIACVAVAVLVWRSAVTHRAE